MEIKLPLSLVSTENKNLKFLEIKEFIKNNKSIQELIETNNFYIVDDFLDAHGDYYRKLIVDPSTIIGNFIDIEVTTYNALITFELNSSPLANNFKEEFFMNPNDFYLVTRGVYDPTDKNNKIKRITSFVLKRKTH